MKEYKRLGDYIREVNVRNRELRVTQLLGLSIHSHGSAREVFDWDELCDVQLPVPSIERQREIVSEYETLMRRLRLNEQMIEKLEATAQALYRHTFVDNIDKQNLPEGWHLGKLGEIFDITIGRTPPRAEEKWFCREAEKVLHSPKQTQMY